MESRFASINGSKFRNPNTYLLSKYYVFIATINIKIFKCKEFFKYKSVYSNY